MTAASPSGPEEAVAPSCRNCAAPAPGAYCPNCGQETALALPSVRALLREAAGRYVALDGRLWRTVLPLLFRPGFLTREYFAGRARRYSTRPHRYAAHLVFGAHNHAFAFLVAGLIVLVPIGSARGALVLWASVYLLWSLKAVYGGRWSGVFARAALISVAYMAAFVVLVAGVLAAAVVLR